MRSDHIRPTLSIIQHLLSVYKLWQEFLPNIPKTARYSLGLKIDSLFVETAELLFMAGYLPAERKISCLEKTSAKFDLVKFFLQISWEIKALDNRKYAALSERLEEIGRMLGGWLRQLASKTPATPAKRGGSSIIG